MHFYKEQPGDKVLKQQHSNGSLHLYTVLRDGIHANGWSRKKFFPNGSLEEEESFSNGLLIEKINFSEQGDIISHKIWNNRLREMVDKPAIIQLPKHNIVFGCASINYFLKNLPSISEFIQGDYHEELLIQSFINSSKLGEEETAWTLKGNQMNFTIFWDCNEVIYNWQCHCFTEELYMEAKKFLDSKEIL
ncbi:hypothetical protein [Sediminibacterium sp.]|uniref:hypothetical protein n=1 Tax=Sediminibacterium sp. TaxID=1917865 RepID=UPI0027355F47|nr:hypothetical protein [Sediminibacterium sp.]MDP3392913.1 hypothetical protein [Sediminibacterium sp.]MDP3567119.1 hypothetical protein [Sediminibacterium sp.]